MSTATQRRFRPIGGKSREEFERIDDIADRANGIVLPDIAEKVVTIVEADKHPFMGTKSDARKEAKRWAIANLANKKHQATDSRGEAYTYEITPSMVGKYLSFDAERKSDNFGVQIAALMKLPEIISGSVEVEIHPDYLPGSRHGEYHKDSLAQRLYGALKIEGKTYRVKTLMIECFDKIGRPYTFEVNEIELSEVSDNSTMQLTFADKAVRIAKLLDGVEKSKDPGVKILEASEKASDSDVSGLSTSRAKAERAQEIGRDLNTPVTVVADIEQLKQREGCSHYRPEANSYRGTQSVQNRIVRHLSCTWDVEERRPDCGILPHSLR